MKTRYALVGASGRTYLLYGEALASTFADTTETVAIFDRNPIRIEAVKKYVGLTCPSYTDFDRMVEETKPDRAIITVMDKFHHEYIIKCLANGIDVFTEKPMTIDAGKCAEILDAERRYGRHVTVGFNYRFVPYSTAIKQAIRDGAVGKVLSVDFEWTLDRSHGADYFRRWHRRKENSGGLLVHKATHHFDLINWWIEEEPREVMAFGARRMYGSTRTERGERCLNCNHNNTCEFFFDINGDQMLRDIYLDCEPGDGYVRDKCIFSDEIDIEDTMSVNVRYSEGALLSYSLVAYSPYEGWRVAINGDAGRLEAAEYHSGIYAKEQTNTFVVYDKNGMRKEHVIQKTAGSHFGGDVKMLDMLIGGGVPDPLGHKASSFEGAVSILVGIAANRSIAEGRNIKIRDLIDLNEYRPGSLQVRPSLVTVG